jgi:copper homeostasis protein (lipoprotein)
MKKLLVAITITAMTGISCSNKLSPDQGWGNQRWILTELKGAPVQLSGTRRDAYIEFSPADKRFSGNAGCNRISGNYILEKKNRIDLGEIISTKMSCDDIAFETSFLSTLNNVNRFESKDNILVLKNGRDILLKFEPRTGRN